MIRGWRSIARQEFRRVSNVRLSRTPLRCGSTSATGLKDEPLRILFCGSDTFSSGCLSALYQYHRSSESNVASIDVATGTDKRTGRGLRTINTSPVKTLALKYGLSIHQFDTFTGWKLPTRDGQTYINMVIAVSFGRLVPPRILNACRFGGLNVHPSLLPDLKGSTPIQHAILYGYERTGVSVQTLHPSTFDEGQVLLQSPLDIRDHNHIGYLDLHCQLAKMGARELINVLRHRLYLIRDNILAPEQPSTIRTAPKLSPESRHIDFQKVSSVIITRMARAFGRLWFSVIGKKQKGNTRTLRMIVEKDIRVVDLSEDDAPQWMLEEIGTGIPFKIANTGKSSTEQNHLYVRCADGKYLCLSQAILSGYNSDHAATLAKKAGLFDTDAVIEDKGISIHPLQKLPSESHLDLGLADLPWLASDPATDALPHT